jgi:hypothetical protein
MQLTRQPVLAQPFVHRPLQIVRTHLRAYLIINAIIYGLMILGFALGLIFPHLAHAQRDNLDAAGTTALVTSLLSNAWLFALVIFGVNAIRVSLLSIILPSMVIPFAGAAYFAYSSVSIGITLAPVDEAGWIALIPHSLTILIEFQAYVLFVLGAYLLGQFWLRPQTIGAANRRQGYLRGVQHIGWLSIPGVALLVIGALYEAFSIIYIALPMVRDFT